MAHNKLPPTDIPNQNTIDITLYNDGVKGVQMPLTINGIDIVGNSSPLAYLERLKKALHLLKEDVEFDAAYPEWVINKETTMKVENGIVWSINQMLPVNLDGKARRNPETGTREVKPRLRKDITLDDGTALRIYGQKFTVYFRFDIFAKSPGGAEDLIDWFQFGFMDHFGGLFGSHRTVFNQRYKDREVEKLNQDLAVRSLEYIVDLERYTAVPTSLVDSIRISVSI
jgi:hypothetical protein